MPKQNLARGVVLMGIALAFSLTALFRLPIGSFSSVGAGLFPLMVSGALLVISLIIIAQSWLVESPPIHFNLKNIAIIMLSLIGFVVLSKVLSMLAGIAWLVFVAGLTAKSYSWVRNLQISIGLVLIAYAFQKLLGFNLGLI